MKKKNASYLALGLIVAPLLIYFLLRQGKQTYHSLPFYGEKVVPDNSKPEDTLYYVIPDFKLLAQNGDTITSKNLDGHIYIASFFFASCRDICPKMNSNISIAYNRLKEYPEIKFVSHTVDPEHDSVPILAEYGKRFGADPKIWYFLTGSRDDILKAGQGYLLPVSMEDRTVDHSQQLILVDKEKHIRGIYDGLEEAEIDRLKDDVKVLLYKYHE